MEQNATRQVSTLYNINLTSVHDVTQITFIEPVSLNDKTTSQQRTKTKKKGKHFGKRKVH